MMRVLSAFLFALTSFVLCSCSMIKSIIPPMPKMPKLPKIGMPSLPSRNTVAKFVPGMSERDKVDSEDPDVPFNSRGTLGFGHTIRLEVYEGTRGPDRIYRGIVMINSEGLLPLGKVGTARVGGLRLPQAAEAIATVFRLAGRNTREITVQIISVENTPVISLNGDVMEPEFIPFFEDMSVKHAVTVTGGRKPGSSSRGVYISRQGQRHFFTSLESADKDWKPQAGDIITLSPDI
jgi:protein involved in polysaccharide export with SLBB domain